MKLQFPTQWPKLSLTAQIFLAFVLGIFIGGLGTFDSVIHQFQAEEAMKAAVRAGMPMAGFLQSTLLLSGLEGFDLASIGESLKPLSDIFLRMIKMLIAPLIFATLVIGIAGTGNHKSLGRIGFKTILYFEIATTVALVIGLLIANLLQPGAGLSIDLTAMGTNSAELSKIQTNADTLAHHSFFDTFVNMIPESVIAAMAKGDILQLVVFSVFFALALIAAGDKGRPIVEGLQSLAEVMFKFVGLVMAFAPLGVLGAISYTIAHNGIGILGTYAKLIGSLYLALALFVLLVLVTVCTIIRVPFTKMIQALKEPFVLAFSTASSESALPKAMTIMERFGVPKHIVAFVMPTGYSFNLDGSTLYLSLATLFVAQMAGIGLSIEQQVLIMLTLMLTSKGVAAVPRASLVILAGTLTAFNLPLAGIAVILGVDHILDMGRTAVNLVGNCVATAVVARWEGVFDDEKMMTFQPEDLEAEGEMEPSSPIQSPLAT